jgi:hypothetical protein
MFATTVQAELNATLHVCESDLQDIRIFLGLVPKESPCIRMAVRACEVMGWFRVTEDRVQLQTILQTEVHRFGYPAISLFRG